MLLDHSGNHPTGSIYLYRSIIPGLSCLLGGYINPYHLLPAPEESIEYMEHWAQQPGRAQRMPRDHRCKGCRRGSAHISIPGAMRVKGGGGAGGLWVLMRSELPHPVSPILLHHKLSSPSQSFSSWFHIHPHHKLSSPTHPWFIYVFFSELIHSYHLCIFLLIHFPIVSPVHLINLLLGLSRILA